MYEYSKRGLGWSELSDWTASTTANSEAATRSGFYCSPTSYGFGARQICFIENDPLEQATAERSGCERAQKRWFTARDTSCRTVPGNNAGKVWCCPENAPQMIPTTPEQRERDTQRLLAEQRAREEGTLPETTSDHATKVATVESGATEPGASQTSALSLLGKVQRSPGWIAAFLAIGAAGFFGYRYFKRQYNRINMYSGVR